MIFYVWNFSKPIFLLYWNLFLKGNQIFNFFSKNKFTAKKRSLCLKYVCHTESLCLKKNVCHTESLCLIKKCFSHWVTVFKKKKTEKNGQKTVKTVLKNCKKGPFFDSFLTVFDCFFLNTVTQCDNLFFLKHSDSVWKTFFFKHSDVFLVVNLFSQKKVENLFTF